MKIPKENTYPYLAILPLLFLYLLLGKNLFTPPPLFNLGICTGDWLIEIFNRIFFVSFCLRVHIGFFCVLYKCRHLCISYFLKKQRTTFLTYRAGFSFAAKKSRYNRSNDNKNPPNLTRAMPSKSRYAMCQIQFGESFWMHCTQSEI